MPSAQTLLPILLLPLLLSAEILQRLCTLYSNHVCHIASHIAALYAPMRMMMMTTMMATAIMMMMMIPL